VSYWSRQTPNPSHTCRTASDIAIVWSGMDRTTRSMHVAWLEKRCTHSAGWRR